MLAKSETQEEKQMKESRHVLIFECFAKSEHIIFENGTQYMCTICGPSCSKSRNKALREWLTSCCVVPAADDTAKPVAIWK